MMEQFLEGTLSAQPEFPATEVSSFDAEGLMVPPWVKYPALGGIRSIAWRMGSGEAYISEFDVWWRQQSLETQLKVKSIYPARGEWMGFYENRTNPHKTNRFRGALLGLACGDAVGTTLEFKQRGMFYDIKDMVGGGSFNLKPGQWTDDTSMALCLAASLVEQYGFDPEDQMRRYCRWMDEGYMSSIGRCFDIGMTVGRALDQFKQTGNPWCGPTDPRTAGNGSIMRLAPVPMYFYPDRAKTIDMCGESSRTTHGAGECIESCRLLGAMLHEAFNFRSKEEILFGHGMDDFQSAGVLGIARGDYRGKTEFDIRGSGYVVKSLEAALWCFWNTDSFEAAILKAANLGEDADTTAAVCGQIAGAFYGESGIPQHWLEKVFMRDEIGELAERLDRSFG